MQTDDDILSTLNDCLGYLNTLLARHYRNRALGGAEVKEYENMQAFLGRAMKVCARLALESQADKMALTGQ
jgi:hypothetical protein